MLAILRSLKRHRALLMDFVTRDLKARYVGSAMGFFWSVVFPIVNLFVFMLVFRIFLKARWGDGSGEKETALIMLTGILAWTSFQETVTRATNCLVENANLIQKVKFPSEILPVNLAVSSLVNMLIGLPIVIVGVQFFTDMHLGASLLAVPILLMLQGIFSIGLGYFFATLNIFLRDTFHVMGVALTVWMFATPIFYPPYLIEENGKIPLGDSEADGYISLTWLLDANPMHWLIDSWRKVMVFGEWPEWGLLLRFALVAIIVFAIGAQFFMSQKKRFPDLL